MNLDNNMAFGGTWHSLCLHHITSRSVFWRRSEERLCVSTGIQRWHHASSCNSF